jgi:DNA-binding NtrC family response regulator
MARVLVIDDDDDTRRMLCEVLTRAGHEAVDAADGRAGVARYRESRADVVITDIFMPERDGLETIREIRREFLQVRIIAISGGGRWSNFDYLPSALMLGAWRTMDKPFSPTALLQAVAEALEENDRNSDPTPA